jgi:aspartate kinase
MLLEDHNYIIMNNIKILKFGGTSMGNADAIKQSASIIIKTTKEQPTVVVVSAVSGVTDKLINLTKFAINRKTGQVTQVFQEIKELHQTILTKLVSKERMLKTWEQVFLPLFDQLEPILIGTSFVGDISDKSYATVCSFGERLSSHLITACLKEQGIAAQRCFSADIIATNNNHLEASVNFTATKAQCEAQLQSLLSQNFTPVVTGFIGRSNEGDLTLLGRGGSDYTAAIIGSCLNASAIEIWTDVDGIMSADPRKVANAKLWNAIDYQVTAEMAHSGAKVLHPKTIFPAIQNNIPVWVKNTFNPSAIGTKIVPQKETGLRGIVVDKEQILIHLTSPSMLDEAGFIERSSACFLEHNISIDLCVTSEVSVTYSVKAEKIPTKLVNALTQIARVEQTHELAKICLIGQNISCDSNILADIFDTLRLYKIYTVAKGASFNNITFCVERQYADEILQLLHTRLFE